MHEVKINCWSCGISNQILLEQCDSKYFCYNCRSELFEDKIINGFIYLLSNEIMPDLLKIGYCTRKVEERVKELNSQTGVPYPFTIEAYFGSDKPEEDERIIHEKLINYRIEKKEFFKISTFEAIEKIVNIFNSKPIYNLKSEEYSANEDNESSESRTKNSEVCPQCGNIAIPDAFKIWVKCHSCGWTKRYMRDPDGVSDLELYLKGRYRPQKPTQKPRQFSSSLREILLEKAEKFYTDGLKEKIPEVALDKMKMAAELGDKRAKQWLEMKVSDN